MNEIGYLIENHYKDCLPSNTINKISSILSNCGIKTESKMTYKSSINTHSLRLVIKGTDIGSNGKGMSEQFAMASAYAEFIERLENLHLDSFTNLIPDKQYGFYLYPDEKLLSLSELTAQKDPFFSMYLKNNGNNIDAFRKLHTLDYSRTKIEDTFISVPFFDYKERKEMYLPYTIYRPWYGSNGMCAGNTPEEAIVQGISEILERSVMRKVISEKIALPEIPESYLKKYSDIYERYKSLNDNPMYLVKLLDCSLGGVFPVVGLLVVEKNTGNYGLKFGAHPCFRIAIERTMTEASQCQDFISFVKNSYLDFSNENVFSEENLSSCFMTGQGQYPFQLFSAKPRYKFCEPSDNSNLSNKELLSKMIDEIQGRGYHVLIRNVSYLGFPVFHVIVPGLSETGIANRSDYEMIHLLNKSVDLFRYPERVNEHNAKTLIDILEHFSYQHYLSFFMHTQHTQHIPFEYAGRSAIYYCAILYIALGDYASGIEILTDISRDISMNVITDEDRDWLLALLYYLSAKTNLHSHNEIMEYMNLFFDKRLCDRLNECFDTINSNMFNHKLFEKLTFKYEKNEIDEYVYSIMKNNKQLMIDSMPKQFRVV